MDDTISRQQVIDALRDYLVEKNVPCDGTLTCRLIENEVVNKLPSAQPEIIHCKDCKYNYGLTHGGEFNPDDIVCTYFDTDGMQGYDYCSYGER